MSQRDYFEKDYYAVLGVDKTASDKEISKAYRKLARELHPDARPNDAAAEARFKEVSEAHAVLSNADKRAEYDKVREMVAAGGGFGGFGGFPGGTRGGYGPGAGGTTFDLGDLLGNLFGQQAGGERVGGRRRGSAPGRRGADVETDLTLSFEDAMAGVTTTLRVNGQASCSTCMGSGAAPGTTPTPCALCGGAGVVSSDQGMFSFSEPCPRCHGRRVTIDQPCPTCRGTGVERRAREIRARIPAGVKDAARIRLKGKGEAGVQGGPPGDLFVNVHVAAHPLFGRRGDDLTLTVPLTFTEAALGTKLKVPTLDEPVTVKVPGGTQSGRTLRVKGRGAPRASGRGDLLVTLDVVVPAKVSREQRKLLEELAATEDGTLRAHLDAALRRA
jgi:molecular chaperone DnaJ